MTSDFDELASAYLDGEVSDADAARIEADPSMQARVNELRAVAEALDVNVAPADEFLRRRQIGAALDAFDEFARPGPATGTGDEDLAGRRHQRMQDEQPSGRAGMPRWLGVAAVLLLIVGGVGLVTQLGGAEDDAFETASDSAELDAEDDTADALADEATAEAAGSAQAAQPSAGDDAGSEATRAASDDEAMEAGEDEEAADDGEDTGAESTSPATSTTAVGGLFPDEEIEAARVPFESAPTQAELLALADGPRFDAAISDCAASLTEDTGVAVEFFVPISVAGVDGEALFTGVEPEMSVVAVDEACVLIE